ncbi:hypothetical protein CHLNCDRAFT_137727 [Chlorella variabilis]|uniref:EVE domain-containing protein n=1 Tax=Chlorella variabilis TaxID=554065 RepID=E1Z4C9_CHLVA|nr:hypothetical protein CHLNCDRAFT_137727 [Chlorella variabilis]EFN59034.1 hypothetical protein CHLNCDRAFT_137727 [Chlorella variabilis]|eukprot:XP_005851136.1 hypothetical protein CHLNCDRAFT_137727 [Chlorella variabilis]
MAPKRAAGGDATGAQPKRKKESKAMEAPVRQPGGLLYFLIKRQVDVLAVSDFDQAPNNTLPITGLHHYGAKKVIETMQVGDEVLFWQSGKASAAGVYALYSVARAAYPDPEDEKNKGFLAFDLKLEEHFDKPVLLSELKEHKDDELEGCSLFSNNALPAHWMSEEHFEWIYQQSGNLDAAEGAGEAPS